MPAKKLICLFALLHFAIATARAETAPDPSPTAERNASQRIDQTLYKGVVGNMLDAVPMDPEQRVTLQRTNAVVSGTLSGRSLATFAKFQHPALLIGGIVWGLWAAANIEPASAAAAPKIQASALRRDIPLSDDVQDATVQVALADNTGSGIGSSNATQSVATVSPVQNRPDRVIRVWLP